MNAPYHGKEIPVQTMTDAELLGYMCSHKLAVVSTIGGDGQPQSAYVGVATTDSFNVVFDTVSTSRKHANLLRDPRIAVTFAAAAAAQTLQYEGVAFPVSTTDPRDAAHREDYYRAWPDGRARLKWPDLAYWRISPRWLRYSDFDRGPLIVERRFDGG
jgi:general stress protein 26